MSSREEGVTAHAPRQRRRGRWLPLLVPVAAALLYAAVWQLPKLVAGHTEGGVLLASRLEGGEWVELQEGVEVPARAKIRFEVRLPRPASVVLIGLSEGRAKLYVPATGSPPRLSEGTSTLSEQFLDGSSGVELFLAEFCNTPLSPAVILKAGERAAAAAGEATEVQTLDLGCPESRLHLLKEASR